MSKESEGNPQNAPTEKERLECEKLRAEIEVVRKPHKSAAFYAALSTALVALIVAVIGGLWTWSSGWFDIQRMRVNNEKTLVEAQTERLKTERTVLESEARLQHAHVSELEIDVHRLNEEKTSLTNQIVRLERERDDMRSIKELVESEVKRLAGADTNASRLFAELQKSREVREALLAETEALRSTNAQLSTSVSNQTEVIIRADRVISEATHLAMTDEATYKKFRPFIDHSLPLTFEMIPYLPWWQVVPDPTNASILRLTNVMSHSP